MTRRTNKTASEMTTLMTLSPFVIASRMTEFWMSAAAPTARSKTEASRMVTEKMQAMGESAVAMNMAISKVAVATALSALSGTVRSPENDADDIISAGLKPYSAAVRANRRRLS